MTLLLLMAFSYFFPKREGQVCVQVKPVLHIQLGSCFY